MITRRFDHIPRISYDLPVQYPISSVTMACKEILTIVCLFQYLVGSAKQITKDSFDPSQIHHRRDMLFVAITTYVLKSAVTAVE